MAPASFTTFKVRSRRPDTAEPRLQVMILVASFWAHCRRVMPRQPARFGSVLISAGGVAAALLTLQDTPALSPRPGDRGKTIAGGSARGALFAPPPPPPPPPAAAPRQRRPPQVP